MKNRHLADGLELLVVLVVAGQQEATVGARPLAFAQVGADHTQVHRVAHALQVILLKLWGEGQRAKDSTQCRLLAVRAIRGAGLQLLTPGPRSSSGYLMLSEV